MAYKRISPTPVIEGGTGDSSITAYSVVCGGTTDTGSLQVVSGLGSASQVLTSNGASMLPTWQDAGGGGGGSVVPWTPVINFNGTEAPITYTSSGNYVQNGKFVYYSGIIVVSDLMGAPGSQLVTVTGLPIDANTDQSYAGNLTAISNDGVTEPQTLVWNDGMETIIYFMGSAFVSSSGQPDQADGGYTNSTMTDATVFQVSGQYISV